MNLIIGHPKTGATTLRQGALRVALLAYGPLSLEERMPMLAVSRPASRPRPPEHPDERGRRLRNAACQTILNRLHVQWGEVEVNAWDGEATDCLMRTREKTDAPPRRHPPRVEILEDIQIRSAVRVLCREVYFTDRATFVVTAVAGRFDSIQVHSCRDTDPPTDPQDS